MSDASPTRRFQFTTTARGTRRREFNGAGDLVHEAILTMNTLTLGLVDHLSGGKVSRPCAGCNKRQDDWNRALPF